MARQRLKGSFLVENRLYAPRQWRRHGRRIQILWRSRHGSAAEGSTERRRKMRPALLVLVLDPAALLLPAADLLCQLVGGNSSPQSSRCSQTAADASTPTRPIC